MTMCVSVQISINDISPELLETIEKLNNIKSQFFGFFSKLDSKIKTDPQNIFIYLISSKKLLNEMESILKVLKDILSKEFDKETIKNCEKITSKIIINTHKLNYNNKIRIYSIIVLNLEILYHIIQNLFIEQYNSIKYFKIGYCDEINKYYDYKNEILLKNIFEALKRIEKLKLLLKCLESNKK